MSSDASCRYITPAVLLLALFVATTLQPVHADDTSTLRRAKNAIETITGRPFREPVRVKPQSRDAFQDYLREQIRMAYGEDDLEKFSRIYRLLGLLPDDYDLRKNLLELYRSQAGAYYDPRTGMIRTLGGELTESQTYFIYLHELVHAHQDQHYGALDEHRKRAVQSFDAMNAFNFVIEGHANLVSMASQLGANQLDDEYFSKQTHAGIFRLLTRFTDIDLSQMDFLEQIAGSSRLIRNLKMMQNTPDILIKQMIDPYFRGQYYWYQEATRRSWDKTLGWLSEPPLETRRIIYRNAEEQPEGEIQFDSYEDVTFSESAGVYLTLRWLGRLDPAPPWGRSLLEDRLRLIETAEDSYLAWSFHFGREKMARQFYRSFYSGSDAVPETKTLRTRMDSNHGTVYLTAHHRQNRVVLYVEDDSDREDYTERLPSE